MKLINFEISDNESVTINLEAIEFISAKSFRTTYGEQDKIGCVIHFVSGSTLDVTDQTQEQLIAELSKTKNIVII